MVDPLTLAAFIPAALALNMTPGADMMFCIAKGLQSGPRAAWTASAGISSGAIVHVLIAGAGLSALLTQWPIALDIIRWIGVAYLLLLAYQSLRKPHHPSIEIAPNGTQAFWTGFIVNLTNPKVILFVLAFIPQFISPEAGPVLLQFAVFGCIIATGGLIINGVVGTWAGVFRRKLALGSLWFDRMTAGIFMLLALRLALLDRN